MGVENGLRHGSEIETVEIPERESHDVEFKSSFGVHLFRPGQDYDVISIDKDGKPLVIHNSKPVKMGSRKVLIVNVNSNMHILDKNGKVRINKNRIIMGQDDMPILDQNGEPIKYNDILDDPAVLHKDYRPGYADDSAKDEVTKAICAMANYLGGRLFIGVNDSGWPHGLYYDRQLLEDNYNRTLEKEIRNYLSKHIAGTVYPKLEFTFPYSDLNMKRICVIRVHPAEECVYRRENGDEILRIRRGASSQSLKSKKSARRYAIKFARRQNPTKDPKHLEEGLTVKFEPSFKLAYGPAKPKSRNRFNISSGIIENICGMANAQGGAIYVGVDSSGTPSGLDGDRRELERDGYKSWNEDDKFERIIFDSLEESMHLEDLIDIRISFHGSGKEYCKIYVPRAVEPVFIKDETRLLVKKGKKLGSYEGSSIDKYRLMRFEE